MRRKRKYHPKKTYYRDNGRNYHSFEYKQYRKEVKKRDDYCCQWPGCKSRKKIQVHHIYRWSDCPSLRFELSNGITLCESHHDLVKNNEEHFVVFFQKVLELKILEKLQIFEKGVA
jgi:hypothetical protein